MATLEQRYQQRIDEYRALAALAPERRREVDRLRAAGDDASRAEALLAESLAAADEEIKYMLDAAPFIMEYTSPKPVTVVAASPPPPPQPPIGGTLDSFVVVTAGDGRNNVLQRYLADVEKVVTKPPATAQQPERDDEDMVCRRCDRPMLVVAREAALVCDACGHTAEYMDTSSACLTYEETWSRDVVSSFAYKRMNHFTEWLNALQAKENTEIPSEVIEAVKAEFKKTRTTTRGEIRPTKVREFLKKLKLNKYYEHCHHICNALNGCPAPKLPPALEDRLKAMFAEIQKPFEKHCPPTRKNFLSYSYVLYKMCELLGEDQYLPYFPLLKSSEKLYLQDQIWRNICRELNWEFIRSI